MLHEPRYGQQSYPHPLVNANLSNGDCMRLITIIVKDPKPFHKMAVVYECTIQKYCIPYRCVHG